MGGAAILCAVFGAFAAGAAEAPPEPDAYRMEEYRAPVPLTLKGASVLSTSEAAALWKDGAAVFIDVLPQAPRPASLPADVIWRDKPRHDIPGSFWLPDVGYGLLSPETLAYFEAGLNKATGGDRAKRIVLYCKHQCWMSWNAAKRALTLGYNDVAWYPDGADGWSDAGFPLEMRTPEPRP